MHVPYRGQGRSIERCGGFDKCVGTDVGRECRVENNVSGKSIRRRVSTLARFKAFRYTLDRRIRSGATKKRVGPDFDASERAFYYVRVLEIPTPRWTVFDAKFFGVDLPEGVPTSIQERAYTTPIWYAP